MSFDLELYNLQIELNEAQERIRELEAQVEAMKCCGNCGWYRVMWNKEQNKMVCHNSFDSMLECVNEILSHWQPKEAQHEGR